MVNKIDIIEFLLNEIKEEKEIFKEYREQRDEFIKQNKHLYLFEFIGKNPSYSKIINNCKKIRQLTLEISKEI